MAQLEIVTDCSLSSGAVAPPDGMNPAALSAQVRAQLSQAKTQGLSILELPAPFWEDRRSALFQTATVVLRTVMDFLPECSLSVRLLCPSEDCATVYRQAYNFWYAGEKSQRLS